MYTALEILDTIFSAFAQRPHQKIKTANLIKNKQGTLSKNFKSKQGDCTSFPISTGRTITLILASTNCPRHAKCSKTVFKGTGQQSAEELEKNC
jgi:hypothetical protein